MFTTYLVLVSSDSFFIDSALSMICTKASTTMSLSCCVKLNMYMYYYTSFIQLQIIIDVRVCVFFM